MNWKLFSMAFCLCLFSTFFALSSAMCASREQMEEECKNAFLLSYIGIYCAQTQAHIEVPNAEQAGKALGN